MNRKKIVSMVAIISLCFLTSAIDWLQWDIINRITVKYNSLVAGMFFYFVLFIKIIAFIILVTWIVRFIRKMYKDSKFLAFLPASIFLITLMLQFWLPLTHAYLDLDYMCNNSKRNEIVAMFQGVDEMKLMQINVDTYVLPPSLRFASHNAKIITERSGGSLKLLFYVHRGLIRNSAIIYVSDDNGVFDGDFELEYEEIRPVSAHWYSVIHE